MARALSGQTEMTRRFGMMRTMRVTIRFAYRDVVIRAGPGDATLQPARTAAVPPRRG